MSTIINGTSSAITFPDTTVQNTAFTTGAVTQSTIATGVAGTGPAFSAYQSTPQSMPGSTVTKVLYQSEHFDTNNNFLSSAFLPTVAGYYQINAYISYNITSSAVPANFTLYKNGGAYVGTVSAGTAGGLYCQISALLYMNGTSDYLECYSGQYSGGAQNVTGTIFSGSLVRAA